MKINAAGKQIVSLWVTICMLVSSFNMVLAAENTEYPNAKLVFSGFTMRYGQNGKIQGLVDVALENIDATGVEFSMKYDANYLVPSNYTTNDPITSAASSSVLPIFNQNRDVFPIVTDEYGDERNYLNSYFGEITSDTINLDLNPDPEIPNSEYIYEKAFSYPEEKTLKCIKADGRNVLLGTLSFEIVNPMAVSKMDENQLKQILSVPNDGNIIYVGDDLIEHFTGTLTPEWKVTRTLLEAEPAVKERTVTAYGIYNDGTVNDLVRYLNRNMNTVIQKYSDGQQLLDRIVWDNNDPSNGFNVDQTYDVLGGLTYTVSQNYMDKTITVKVNVTRVTIKGFKYDNRIKTFIDPDRPSVWSDLLMPATVTPILEGIDDMYIPPSENPNQTDWNPNDVTENLKTGTAPLSEQYIHTVNQAVIAEPWLTIPDNFNWDIDAYRNVIESEYKPDADKITASVERETGILTINVGSVGGGQQIQPGTEFNIYLPNGMIIKSADNDFVQVTVNADGSATIKIEALMENVTNTAFTDAEREGIQSIINLGSKDFKLTAVKDSVESEQAPFVFDARENYYLGETGTNYVDKDYSEGRKSMFPVYTGQKLSNISTYIAFPDNSTIPVAYHGQTGIQPSELSVAKVESWEIEGDSAAAKLPSADGTTVTLVGKLAQYTYTDFGTVTNPDNVYLRIKVTVVDNPNPLPTPTAGPESTATPNPDATPSPTPNPDATPSPTPNPDATPSPTPDPDATPSPTPDPDATPSPTPDPDATPSPTPSPTPTATPNPNPTPNPDTGEAIKITTEVNGFDVLLNPNGKNMTFEYDKQKVGYLPADVQEQTYTIENIGLTQIDGLTVRISDITADVNSSATSYVLSEPLLVNMLSVGDTTTFAIRTKCGLPAGTYKARVSVGSNKSTELGGFDISFIVTENDVYRVTVDPDGADVLNIGYGYLMTSDGLRVRSNTYEENEQVDVYAVLIDTAYKFDEWTSDSGVTFANSKSMTTAFTMPANDVTVIPKFMESPQVWIRLTDLKDFNADSSQNPLRSNVLPYPITTFDEAVSDYRVIVDGDVEKNYIEFDLKSKLINDITTTVTTNGNICNTTQNGTAFTSDLFDLNEGLNIVTIKTEYTDPGDGQRYTQTYTLYILRKKAVDVKLGYGNSPFGLIESDTSFTDTKKAAAKAYFSQNHTYGKDNVPERAANTYQTMYYTDAWTAANYDENPYALFVYNNTVFVDPGFSDLKDSDGNAVDASTVVRTIKFDELVNSTSDVIADLDSSNIQQQTVTIPSGGTQCVIDLTAYRIRPGAYSIEYSFHDVDGSERKFSRPLIILAQKGDVTLDKTVTSADYDLIYQRIGNGYYKNILLSNEEWAKIYAYRIGDVTEDRNVNSIDANAIKNTVLTEYYEPLPTALNQTMPTYDASTAVWQPLATLPPDKATLTLDYLGTGTQPMNKAQTPDLVPENVGSTTGQDIVWVGVGIKKPQNLQYFLQGIYSMDFAVDYDPTIFVPCDEYGNEEGSAGFNLISTIKQHNIDSGVTTSDTRFWNNAELYEPSLQTKAELDLTGKYKTEFITMLSKDGTDLRMNNITQTDDTIYLMRIPFKLIKYPDSAYTGKAVTLRLTEHTFVMGSDDDGVNADGVSASASWEGLVDKTTEVNNLENHFDGVEIVDIFNTDGKFNITGKIKAWNPKQPIKAEIYKSTAAAGDPPEYTFLSSDKDAAGQFMYGELKPVGKKGECEWEFSLPVSNRFEYKMVITKLSHLTYPDISIEKSGVVNDIFAITDTITLIVGDINGDQIIKFPDRAELMRFLNRQKPWKLDLGRFEAADLNGDDTVSLFDLNLLQQNYGKAYSVAQPSPSPSGGSGTGGGSSS